MRTSIRQGGWKTSLLVLAVAVGIWSMAGAAAFAQRGGGMHGGGGFAGGHMGGFAGGRVGGFGGFAGPGWGGRGWGWGGRGWGWGGRGWGWGGGGWGWGWPGFGFGYGGFFPYYGLGYGLGYGYGGLGYGDPYFGWGYGYDGLGYGGLGYGGLAYGGLGYGGYPAAGFGYSSAYVPPALDATGIGTSQRRVLGIDEEPVDLADGKKGMKITKVYPGTAAEGAGLQVGDVLRSANGYLTEQRGNLAWILANATPDNTLKMKVQSAKDGKDKVVTATLQ
jgi:hypothetical protein